MNADSKHKATGSHAPAIISVRSCPTRELEIENNYVRYCYSFSSMSHDGSNTFTFQSRRVTRLVRDDIDVCSWTCCVQKV